LPCSLENGLRAAARVIANYQGWRGMGTIGFALDDRSGMFRVIETRLHTEPSIMVSQYETLAAHALEVRIDDVRQDGRWPLYLLVCGVTRGEALRRAYRALSEMASPASTDIAFLMRRIASRSFCMGLTGSRLDQAED
jgi:acetyl/propionyl-CoA carboxylase alpha subunit